jgi:DNA-binding LacI/PurR family transcriptional regulator
LLVVREPTMADIAARVGVSRQLVSIVLRDAPGASEATRVRVRRAAQELGYRPHLGARALRRTQARLIGVAFAPSHASELDIVESIYPAAAARGHDVVLSALTHTRTTRQAVDQLLGYRCSAVIVIGSQLSGPHMRALARHARVPVVAVGRDERNAAYDVVRSAGDQGIATVVEHLVALGHDRVTFVHCPSMPLAALRLAGYLRAVSEAGCAADLLEVRSRHHTQEAGAMAGRRLIRRRSLPTAVVTGNDEQALGLLQVLARAGVGVPGDVSVTGFGDLRFASSSAVDLTTSRVDPGQMGTAAVAAAVRRLEDPGLRPELRVVRPTLVVRGSTAPAGDAR